MVSLPKTSGMRSRNKEYTACPAKYPVAKRITSGNTAGISLGSIILGLAVVFADEEKSLVDSDRDGLSPTMLVSLVIGHNVDVIVLGPTDLMALLEPQQNAEATDAIIMLAVQTLNILSISFPLLLFLLMDGKISTMNPRKLVNLSLSPA